MPKDSIHAKLQQMAFPWRALEKKRIFFIFAILALFLLIVAGVSTCYLVWPRLAQLHPAAPIATSILIGGFVLGIGLVLFMMMLSAALERNLRFHWGERIALLWLLPLAVHSGKIFNISKERVRNSFVNVNNALVRALPRKLEAKDLLVLLPRCLQNTECPYRVTEDIHYCHGCGKCALAALIELEQRYDFRMFIVTGGSLARRKVAELRPRAIVAVACEYELVTGIEDVLKIPVIGVLNERPEGPCKNTGVDIAEVESAVRFFLRL